MNTSVFLAEKVRFPDLFVHSEGSYVGIHAPRNNNNVIDFFRLAQEITKKSKTTEKNIKLQNNVIP